MLEDFISSHKLLREDYSVEALVDFDFTNLRDRIYSINDSGIIAIVGAYGSGKSTALHQVKISDDANSVWLRFDAWRYPERKGLWEGLIIEVARQLGEEKSALRSLDGHKSIAGKWGGAVAEAFEQIKAFIPHDALGLIKDGQSTGAAASKVGSKIADLFEKSPAKRAYEMERILSDLLLSVASQDIFLVVEDIDRSGDDGVNFLETLNYFLKNTPALEEKNVIVLAPMSNRSYEENVDAYIKCVDYFEFFVPRIKSMDGFISAVFDPRLFGTDPARRKRSFQQIKDFLEGLYREFPDMNTRKLKLILRNASLVYRQQVQDGLSPDWRITVCIEASKYLPKHWGHTELAVGSSYDQFLKDGHVHASSFFAKFLCTLISERTGLYQEEYDERLGGMVKKLTDKSRDLYISKETTEPKPMFVHEAFDSEPLLNIAAFYFSY